MAMRRIWVLVCSTLNDGTYTFEIEDDGGAIGPAVYYTFADAKQAAADSAEAMLEAVRENRMDIAGDDFPAPYPAWLLDETGVISLEIDGVKIANLLDYCIAQGQV